MPLSPFRPQDPTDLFCTHLRTYLQAQFPYVALSSGCLGDDRTLFVLLSMDAQITWSNGIYYNSRYLIVRVRQVGNDLVLEHVNAEGYHATKAPFAWVQLPKVRKQPKTNLTKIEEALGKWADCVTQLKADLG